MDDLLERIEELSEEISFHKSNNDVPEQLDLLSQGIDEMSRELKSIDLDETTPDYLRNQRNEIAKHLADFYGRRGGILRRLGRVEESLASYQCGAEIELNVEYGVVNSYNSTNAIVLDILANPEGITALQTTIARARDLVRQHVAGPRRHSCWAWADLAFLHLAGGHRAEALHAYQQSLGTQYPAWAVDSTTEVLRECAEKLADCAPDIATSMNNAAAFLTSSHAKK